MLPITDFNFVFAGLATVAATMGYAYTRRQNPTVAPFTSGPSSAQMVDSASSTQDEQVDEPRPVPGRRASLKRKVPDDGFDDPVLDEGYPNNLRHIYPFKRSKTPSSESDKEPHVVGEARPAIDDADTVKDADATRVAVNDIENPTATDIPAPIEMTVESAAVEVEEVPPADTPVEPSPVVKEDAPVPEVTIAEAPVTPPSTLAPLPPVDSTPQLGSLPPTLPCTPRPSAPSTVASPFQSNAFASFAGSKSPFASVKKTPQATFRASLWNADDTSVESSTFRNSLGSALGGAEALRRKSLSKEKDSEEEDDSEHAISAAPPSEAKKLSIHATGEEFEDVEQEIKGVKLFVKRGSKPYASGMVGHLKLLSNKTTLAERLLFRREPLWQVSMNVRINPTTRCVYSEEENALRLTLKEPVAVDGKDALELVVYALKPGKTCSKKDFKDFAESLVKNAQFQNAQVAKD